MCKPLSPYPRDTTASKIHKKSIIINVPLQPLTATIPNRHPTARSIMPRSRRKPPLPPPPAAPRRVEGAKVEFQTTRHCPDGPHPQVAKPQPMTSKTQIAGHTAAEQSGASMADTQPLGLQQLFGTHCASRLHMPPDGGDGDAVGEGGGGADPCHWT